jgi:hypothetical protein
MSWPYEFEVFRTFKDSRLKKELEKYANSGQCDNYSADAQGDNLFILSPSFGVINTAKFTGKLTLVPNVATSGLWEVPMTDAFVNGQPIGFVGRTSITDTGTSMLFE